MALHTGIGKAKGHLNRLLSGGKPKSYSADFTTGSYSGSSPQNTNASGGYIDDSQGNWSFVPANTLRRSDKGLLVEGAQTNNIRNNSMQGAAVGSPGTLPTNWASSTSSNGITRSVSAVGTENGIDYIDFRFAGTATANTSMNMDPDTPTTAASGQFWIGSTFAKFVSGSAPNVTYNIQLAERGGSSTPNTVLNFTPTSASLSTQRFSVSRTLSIADSTGLQQRIFAIIPSGAVVDFTIRIGWPQLERMDNYTVPSRGQTSPIRTTGTAATRNADAVSFTVPNGASKITYTFDDNSTQQVTVTPGQYTIPTNLNRPYIKSLLAS